MTVYRFIALGVAAISATAMLYVGLYQSRFVGRLICPIFPMVAKASQMRHLRGLSATVANIIGLRDMINLGSFCYYCLTTTILSPVLSWAVWQLK